MYNKESLEHFGVTENQLINVLSAALEKGGDYADMFFEHTVANNLSLQDSAVNKTSSNIDFGVGIRVVSGDRTGYAYTETVTPEDMLKAAHTAARIAESGKILTPVALTVNANNNNFYRIEKEWDTLSVADKVPYLQSINDKLFVADQRIIKVTAWLNDATTRVMFCNSEGQFYWDERPLALIGAQCIMEVGGRRESNSTTRSLRMGAEFLTSQMIDTMVSELIDKTQILFEAIKPHGGEMPVVMGAGGSGILLHEAIGHAFEADFNRKNISIFSECLGKKICDASINIVDDGTVAFNRGAVNIDDEGVAGQKTYIVSNGVLTNYLHDRISARHYGVCPTGNGRRESFRNMPVPRMRATYMESGFYSEEEIISAVKHGVYVSNFSNGQVEIGAGDFTFFVKNGYLIENGRLTQPLKDINIIGNGPQALADVTMTGSNFMMDEGSWTCGKDGQSCPVSLGMPSVLVGKLTVGGE
ncbi:MAG: TldD/PmbA family protein [Tannerella sp.]|jgi:TldD protein|nr:TldD/PmbA family protein [Tannerella sp.]